MTQRTNDQAPFNFADLNGEPEPERWGPRYSKPAKPGKLRRVEPPTNAPSGQPYDFSATKHRAKLKAEFTARANADRRAWADGKPIAIGYATEEGYATRNAVKTTIVEAYEEAMKSKRLREGNANALRPRKPHYMLRAGQWVLKEGSELEALLRQAA